MKTILIFTSLSLVFALSSCRKDSMCYDESLKSKSIFCQQDCPGVCGCDGKFYCNDCIARQNGILVTTPGDCKN